MSAEFCADFSELAPARDQGDRPTCLSFAISETHRSAISSRELLSPESLHRRSALRARKLPEHALTPLQVMEGLEQEGQTNEVAWPYHSENPHDPNCTYFTATSALLAFDIAIIEHTIRSGRSLCLVLDIDLNFFLSNGADALEIDFNSVIQGRHAVALCGFRDGPSGKEFYIKNSWGDGWAAMGFAWLTEQYVLARSPLLIRI